MPSEPAQPAASDPQPKEEAPPQEERALTLATPVQYAPGAGPRRAELFERLGIRTVAELIKHLPHRYEYHAGESPIESLPVGTIGTGRGTIVNCRWVPGRSSPIGKPRGGRGRFTAQLRDSTGFLDLVWFNAPYLRKKLHPGMEIVVTGKVNVYRDQRQMANPSFRIVEAEEGEPPEAPDRDEHHRPIYPATEQLPTEQIERIIRRTLPEALPEIEDHLSEEHRAERNLPDLREAYRMLHRPADEDEIAAARRRLAYDELLLLQLAFALKRQQARTDLAAPALRYSEAIDEHIRQRFPFKLTRAQDTVVREIAGDLQRQEPMNRLLQGDVGSGKTVVALYAMLMAVASEKQAALMAPTELLAEQHYLSIASMLEGSNVRIALLTGSLTQGERASLKRRAERGELDIVIGTHAMLSQSIQFNDLALVVVDEQHRFGVAQRAAIRSKAGDDSTIPHTLIMTATPIPRTLSLTVFGDLDVSTITGLPPGRQPIVTRAVGPEKADEVYQYLAKRIGNGEQAYIVLPAIDDPATTNPATTNPAGSDGTLSDASGSNGNSNSTAALKAVRSHAEQLQNGPLAGRHVSPLHGKMKRRTRERIMHRFREGKIDAIVATTVIEVGVDVPNASLMVVEHAERFGLAQLHQLRGRVGRGNRKSLCVFIAEPSTDDGRDRIDAIAKTTDGFKVAEADLKIRGMGELLGTKQSGLPPLRVADLEQHIDLLKLAKRDAEALAERDPRLADPAHELLRKRLLKQYGKALGLADVA